MSVAAPPFEHDLMQPKRQLLIRLLHGVYGLPEAQDPHSFIRNLPKIDKSNQIAVDAVKEATMWNPAEHETEQMYLLHVLDEFSDTVDATVGVLEEMALAENVVELLRTVASCVEACRQTLDEREEDGDLEELGNRSLTESDYDNLADEAESLCDALAELQDSEEDLPAWALEEASDRMSDAIGELLRFHLDPVVKKGFHTYHVLLRAA